MLTKKSIKPGCQPKEISLIKVNIVLGLTINWVSNILLCWTIFNFTKHVKELPLTFIY